MRAIKLKDHDTEEELLQEIRNTKNGRYQHRLRTILLAKRGISSKSIREEMLISSATYSKWLKNYNEHGKEILKQHNSGRKDGNPKYEEKIFKEVFEKLDLMEEYWSIPKMQRLVLELHNVQVPDETMRMRIKRAGYSYKSNRPSPYKGDADLQDNFKKVVSQMWSKS
jgi:transposase